MQIIKLSQTEDRESWLDARRGLITGSKAKGVKPLTRGADRTPSGFWELLAENLAIAKDGEPERDRGLRLENDALKLTAKQFKLKLDYDPGMWISDLDSNIAVSPDSAEIGDTPSYAVEAKCLDSKNHLQAIVKDHLAKQGEEYNPLESLKVGACDFRDQAIQYFAVNEHLNTLYFSFYDDRIVLENLMHYTIVIQRDDVGDLPQYQVEAQQEILKQVKSLIKELKKV